ncbi:hypothetical protein L798_10857 [Zootermopsis nevadensis]|uniref:Uncharacterized protein n=1 Tax=Zootermopsis nevadensis TaxID=136037 RepID=A0A067QY30_ZOONE|nr:hypothetical protein L798_10857 [Zootermopsis nevadensis]
MNKQIKSLTTHNDIQLVIFLPHNTRHRQKPDTVAYKALRENLSARDRDLLSPGPLETGSDREKVRKRQCQAETGTDSAGDRRRESVRQRQVLAGLGAEKF